MKRILYLLLLVSVTCFGQLPIGTERKTVITDTNGNVISTPLTFSNQVKMAPAPTATNHLVRLMDLNGATNNLSFLTNGLAPYTFVIQGLTDATNYADSVTNGISFDLSGMTGYVDSVSNNIEQVIIPSQIAIEAVRATNYANSVTNGFVSSVSNYNGLTATNLYVYTTVQTTNIISPDSGMEFRYDQDNANLWIASFGDIYLSKPGGASSVNIHLLGDLYYGNPAPGAANNAYDYTDQYWVGTYINSTNFLEQTGPLYVSGKSTFNGQVDFDNKNPTNCANATLPSGVVNLSQLQAGTNGYVKASVTNGLASISQVQGSTNGVAYLSGNPQTFTGTNSFYNKLFVTNSTAGNGSYAYIQPDDNAGMALVGTNSNARLDLKVTFGGGVGQGIVYGPGGQAYVGFASPANTGTLNAPGGITLSTDPSHSITLTSPGVNQAGASAAFTVTDNGGGAGNNNMIGLYPDGVDDWPSLGFKRSGGSSMYVWMTNNAHFLIPNLDVTNSATVKTLTVNGNETVTNQVTWIKSASRIYTNTYSGTTCVVDAANGDRQSVILTNNTTLVVSNLASLSGNRLSLNLWQDSTGGRVSTISVTSGRSLTWQGGFTPTNSAGANLCDKVAFEADGTNILGIGSLPVQTVYVTNISSLPKLIIANAAAQTLSSGTITAVSVTNCSYNTDTANTFWTWDTNNSYGVFKSNCWIKVSGGVPISGTTFNNIEFWIGSTNVGAPSYQGYGIFPDLWYADAMGVPDKYRMTFSQSMYVTNGHPFAFGVRVYGTGTLQIDETLPQIMQILIEPIP